MALDVHHPSPEFLAFWREYHLCTLTTLRADGTPHVVAVGVTYDPEAGLARVITNKNSRKVANILASGARSAGASGARVAVCQVHKRRWATLEGVATIRTEREAVADAESRYAERYGRTPAPNPDRVVIEIALDRALGRA
ncbi:pyridoxamine 5'-phosphate oxidase family protein [Streptomyces sp. SID3212]|uniref:pyridoxamine 5'-phosphate oxidase family protein n=1 Tax=unclassified Streptomyces TaxID=2593676 RepID=UPI00136F74D4|nr:pyridoxamine 5'-phosphate oxidase family protein [Streptomyces sp. SID3212]MYV55733.1 nitrilase [Streptomyces sp. SID3212]